jgi:hypothetical protein
VHKSWGTSLFYLSIYLIFHLMCFKCLWRSEDSIFVHFLYWNILILKYAQILGSFSIFYFKHSFAHIITSCCFHLDSFVVFNWLSDLVIACIIWLYFGNLWVLDIVLLPPKYSSLDMCEGTPLEEVLLYWPSRTCHPFRQSMPMGEKF